MNKNNKKYKLTIRDIALIGMMVAVIEVCKAALNFLPNIELTTFWIIMFTLFFGWKILWKNGKILFITENRFSAQKIAFDSILEKNLSKIILVDFWIYAHMRINRGRVIF